MAYHDGKTIGFSNRPEHWLRRGHSEVEARQLVSGENQRRSIRGIEKNRGRKDISCFQVGFWIARGLTEQEAVERVGLIQARGLSHYERKYGKEEGFHKWKDRQQRWFGSLKEAETADPSIRVRRTVRCGQASKQSMSVFNPLIDWCEEHGLHDIYVGYGDRTEWFLWSQEGDLFWYDFTIPSIKVIIEFHGSKFHPNPARLDETNWREWKCLYSLLSADDKHLYDDTKAKVASQQGFDVLIVWDDDPLEDSIRVAKDFILSHEAKSQDRRSF